MSVISREDAKLRGLKIIEPEPPAPKLPGAPVPISGPTPGWNLPMTDVELVSMFHGLKLLSPQIWTESGFEIGQAVAIADLLRRIQPAVVEAVKRMKPARAAESPLVVVAEREDD